MSTQYPLVDVRQLSVSYRAGQPAVNRLSLSIAQGETLAIVGESGSGKSTLANAILGLLPDNAQISAGELWVDGNDLTHASERQKRTVRGRTVGLVPQDPMVSLNPTLRIGQQIAEALILAKGKRYPGVDADIVELLQQVGIDKPVLRARQYPHELSGGMRQRVLIAIALAGNPRLIIADEPTSALDVTVQAQVLALLQQLQAKHGLSYILITHDASVIDAMAHQVLRLENGRVASLEAWRP